MCSFSLAQYLIKIGTAGAPGAPGAVKAIDPDSLRDILLWIGYQLAAADG